jgi:hypothetical protein
MSIQKPTILPMVELTYVSDTYVRDGEQIFDRSEPPGEQFWRAKRAQENDFGEQSELQENDFGERSELQENNCFPCGHLLKRNRQQNI